jgi:hypothetical protein
MTEEEKRVKREKMRQYQRQYYLKNKFRKDMKKPRKQEVIKTIQIHKGEFTVHFA